MNQQKEIMMNTNITHYNYSSNNYDADDLGNQINYLKSLVQSTSIDLERDFSELENKLENLIKKK